MNERETRARLVAALHADLVGPFVAGVPGIDPSEVSKSDEVLPLPPSRWYLTGFLAPQGDRAPELDDDDSNGGELPAGDDKPTEEGTPNETETKRGVHFPASMGLSVFLPPKEGVEDSLEVEIDFALYDKIEVATDHERKVSQAWKRVPMGPVRVAVPLDATLLKKGIAVPGQLTLKGELQTTDMTGLEGVRVLSLFVVNTRAKLEKDRDLHFVFQVKMTLHYARGFEARPNRRGEDSEKDHDLRVLALLFRDRKEWAVGHNTSVVQPTPDADGRVRRLETTQLPAHEVPKVEPAKIADVELAMSQLARLDGAGLSRALTPIVDHYDRWIHDKRGVHLERKGLEDTRDELMSKALQAKKRIEEGIALLASDALVREAFQLANEAMHVAAAESDKHREEDAKRYRNGRVPSWHAFQIAFVLMNLGPLSDPNHAGRQITDLIYFPTGGGKTEAYLGLIAFTLVLRRLRGKARPDEGRGVSVILRYTLRLLTLDQLARASTLICALEARRKRDPKKLGNKRFAIGLWVGRGATANRLKEVNEALNDFAFGRDDSPFPLTHCPWCAEEIRIQNVKLVTDEGTPSKTKFTRAVVHCGNAGCAYCEANNRDGLPILFVDEQIYQELPDFIVATVDKFAMLPWRTEAGMLFGRATHLDDLRVYGSNAPPKARPLPDGLRPPELIVQDELHLISGPLGTMVGLYESAVEHLSRREIDGVTYSPKIVCSTATVRRAREQIRALFNREMQVFPPRGIDEGDNFFSITREVTDDNPGRLYVGVGASGRALRAVSVRTYATLLAAAAHGYDPKGKADQASDPYMTLIGYFNSLRELGGMRRLVEDEVRNRIKQFAEQKRPHHWIGTHPWGADRDLGEPAELTSRESTDRVKRTKARLATRHASKDQNATPLDVVLASNMIAVGLDVDRLGLMVVTGQPKTTSEYIQATSRVGRASPGLVVTCLNVMRPRDRSHYERFVAYHQSFYREVEATSVTPFSHQALDRGLTGTLVSMIRHSVEGMQAPLGWMELHKNRARADDVLRRLVERARKHRGWQNDIAEAKIANYVSKRGGNLLDAWERIVQSAVEGSGKRVYSEFDRAKTLGKEVLYTANREPPIDHDEQKFEAPTSMRDVEATTHFWVRFKALDER